MSANTISATDSSHMCKQSLTFHSAHTRSFWRPSLYQQSMLLTTEITSTQKDRINSNAHQCGVQLLQICAPMHIADLKCSTKFAAVC